MMGLDKCTYCRKRITMVDACGHVVYSWDASNGELFYLDEDLKRYIINCIAEEPKNFIEDYDDLVSIEEQLPNMEPYNFKKIMEDTGINGILTSFEYVEDLDTDNRSYYLGFILGVAKKTEIKKIQKLAHACVDEPKPDFYRLNGRYNSCRSLQRLEWLNRINRFYPEKVTSVIKDTLRSADDAVVIEHIIETYQSEIISSDMIDLLVSLIGSNITKGFRLKLANLLTSLNSSKSIEAVLKIISENMLTEEDEICVLKSLTTIIEDIKIIKDLIHNRLDSNKSNIYKLSLLDILIEFEQEQTSEALITFLSSGKLCEAEEMAAYRTLKKYKSGIYEDEILTLFNNQLVNPCRSDDYKIFIAQSIVDMCKENPIELLISYLKDDNYRRIHSWAANSLLTYKADLVIPCLSKIYISHNVLNNKQVAITLTKILSRSKNIEVIDSLVEAYSRVTRNFSNYYLKEEILNTIDLLLKSEYKKEFKQIDLEYNRAINEVIEKIHQKSKSQHQI